MKTRFKAAASLLCLATLVAGGTAAGTARAAEEEGLVLTALTGPSGGQITISVPDSPSVDVFPQVQVKLIAPAGTESAQRVLNLNDVPAADGTATVMVDPLERGAAVIVQAHVREQTPPRTAIYRGTTTAKLRPDLIVANLFVATVDAALQTLSKEPFDVVAEIHELNTDVGATATATLMLGPTPIAAAKPVTVGPGATTSITFEDVTLETPITAELTVRVEKATPVETDDTNNARNVTIEVTEHELVRPTSVLVQALGGYGAQFNQHVYASVTPTPPGSLPALEDKVKALEPQLVRIFFHEVQERTPDQMASFIETVELAQQSGATINITYHTAANAKLQPDRYMGEFAAILDDLVRTRGFVNIRWVTVQNEVNSTGVTKEQYNELYRALDVHLRSRGLRDQILLMGGDLIESSSVVGSNHKFWFDYMAESMNDVLDAYSVHIYWNYWDIPRMEFRLRSVREIVRGLSSDAQKPVYITEFGVRGIQNLPGLPAVQPGYWSDGTPLSRTNIAAFQHLWFDLVSAQLGFSGAVKWDAYWGRYTAGYRETYNLIGPPEEGWPLFPAYHALRLLFQTTQRGWQVVQVAPWEDDDWRLLDDGGVRIIDQPEKEIAAYTAPSGELTLMGLDTHGRDLNSVSAESPQYSIGNLTPGMQFNLVLWNASGNGENALAGTVTANDAGVARFQVPLHAAFALTTVPVS